MKIIGHRGARGLAPENTIAALKKAIEHNVDEVEFDVRVTKDKVAVLHHNRRIKSRNGQKLWIHKAKYADLKAHKPDLATLQEALVALPTSAKLYIEVKPRVDIKPIVKLLKADNHEFHIASKNQKTLLALHRAIPDKPTIVIHAWSGVIASHRARKLNTKRISMNHHWLWGGFISRVAKSGYQLSTYTINDPIKAKKWQKLGLYAVVTDRPDLFEK